MKLRDFIKYLLDFNPDAEIKGNISGNPFDININKHIAWCTDDEDLGNIKPGDSKKRAGEVFIDFTYPELNI